MAHYCPYEHLHDSSGTPWEIPGPKRHLGDMSVLAPRSKFLFKYRPRDRITRTTFYISD